MKNLKGIKQIKADRKNILAVITHGETAIIWYQNGRKREYKKMSAQMKKRFYWYFIRYSTECMTDEEYMTYCGNMKTHTKLLTPIYNSPIPESAKGYCPLFDIIGN